MFEAGRRKDIITPYLIRFAGREGLSSILSGPSSVNQGRELLNERSTQALEMEEVTYRYSCPPQNKILFLFLLFVFLFETRFIIRTRLFSSKYCCMQMSTVTHTIQLDDFNMGFCFLVDIESF